MANNTTFKLYTDSGLTQLYGGTSTFTHESDLSDGSQDLQLWFGSNTASRQLQATSNPGTDNITLTPTDILPAWQASTAYILGDTIEPTTDNGFRYVCSTAGTTGASEPTWSTTIGNTVTDGTVIWAVSAQTHEPTEIKLATTAAGLDSATAGAALSLGTTVTSGVGNAVEINIRVTNTVTTVSTNVGNPEISIDINSVIETAV